MKRADTQVRPYGTGSSARLKIDAAFALDEHFNQFGKRVVHPT